MYHARWQIELFFKHIKQHMTIKTFFSQSEKGVQNQLILTMISALLTFLIVSHQIGDENGKISVPNQTILSLFTVSAL
ncbi:hypothetical protein EfmAA610_32220 (plasmid) [Enterococcus faecium]|nr:hypothetical protein EfmAA610_32220 [Enterococcus faecium]